MTTLIDHSKSWNVKANQDVITEAENTIQAVSEHYIEALVSQNVSDKPKNTLVYTLRLYKHFKYLNEHSYDRTTYSDTMFTIYANQLSIKQAIMI